MKLPRETFDEWLQRITNQAATEEGERDEEFDEAEELNEPARLIQERILEDYVRP